MFAKVTYLSPTMLANVNNFGSTMFKKVTYLASTQFAMVYTVSRAK